MELRLLKILIFAFVIHCANAKKFSGGGGSRRTSGGSRSRPSTTWGHSTSHNTPSHTSIDRPSSTSFNSGRTSSTNFLHAESGRPSLPANYHPSYNPAPRPSVSHTPSAPSFHPTDTHNSNLGRPSSVVNERHQQNSASVSHNNPYERQPAYNPHVSNGFGSPGSSSGTHSSPPYPLNQPNHPQPSNIGSSSFPTSGAYHPVSGGAGVHHPPPVGGGYQPVSSGGLYHPPANAGYQPPMAGGYHPVSGGGLYHPPANAGYQPPMAGGYHPVSSGGLYHPPTGGAAYHAPAGVYHPPTYSQPPSHTVYVVPDSRGSSSSGRPGIGTYIASGVAGGVAAGATNAIVDHAISSIFRPNSHGVHTYPSAPAPGTPTTSITNNYYYSSGAPAPASGQPEQPGQSGSSNGQIGQPAQVAPSRNSASTTNDQGPVGNYHGDQSGRHNGVVGRTPEQPVDRKAEQPQEARPDGDNAISDDELMKLSEDLFDNLNTNINQYVELNLQKRVSIIDGPLPDEASEPLFIVKPGLDSLPTVSKLKALYNSYQRNGTQKEIASFDRQNKENAFLDEVMKTPVMKKALNWLSEKHYVKPNDHDQKELLRSIWFTIFGETSSSFEHVFLSENYGQNGIVGMQNWIYVADQEAKNNVDYMGYVDMLSLSGKGALLKVNLKSEGTPLQGLPMFIGTPPELEMALYTVCMHTRFNGYCPVSLGGAKLFISTQAFKQNNNYLIDVALPLL